VLKRSKNKNRKTGMARLWELAAAKKALVISSCVLSVISVVVSFTPFIAVYYIIRELVTHYAGPGSLNRAWLLQLGWIAGGGAAGAVFLNFAALMCSHFAAFSTLYALKLDFTRHIASLPLGFHTQNSSGKLRKIVDENIEKLENFIAHQLPDLAGSFAMPVVTLIVLFLFDWRLGLASFVPVLLTYLIQAIAFGGGASKTFMKQYQDTLESMNNTAVEYVRGIAVVKAFGQTIYSFRKFYETIKAYGKYCLDYTINFEIFMELFIVIINQVYLFLVPVIILLAGGAANYSAFAMAAVFYLVFSVYLSTPFTKLVYVSQTGRLIADGIERMDRIVDVPSLPETVHPKMTHEYSVSFEGVSFSYNGEDESVALRDLSFTAAPGELTALVGPSGSGKSTIAHLIPRFYDPAEGTIKIGGVDIRDMTNEYLMSLVSFVFQDVFLFKQSVIDNILIGNKKASREEAVAAAKAAQCHEFIEALPQGYDTVIGARNVNLSGGERQRLVIARALLKDAPIIVLDEATAFADSENEQKIQRAFEKLMKNKTVIIIAHRLSTVRRADKIVVMDKGIPVEQGRHDELARAGGLYQRMWEQYSLSMKWTVAGNRGSAQIQSSAGGTGV
jgi:ATP-binding cassette subfamily B protein